ncbi:MAG: sigma-54-dependent Fis family transcriptional regulator, partial [Planctomycetaceae bacterium]
LTSQLPDIASEYGAQWTAVLQRTPDWRVVSKFGHRPPPSLPYSVCDEALDREACGLLVEADGPLMILPVSGGLPSSVLVMHGSQLSQELETAAAISQTLELGLRFSQHNQRAQAELGRLEAALNMATIFAQADETEVLLELIAEKTKCHLDCDRATIFLWERQHKQLVGCPALGLDEMGLRIPDNEGIAGQTVQTGETIRVDDAYADSRFHQDIDKQSGYQTRSLLCVPLRDEKHKTIGAFEAINKRNGSFDENDEHSLNLFATQAATALTKLRQHQQLVRTQKQLLDQVTQGVQIVGNSPAITALRSTITRLAATDLPVLILGESGTGKEIVAQSLHHQGPRAEQPFVAVNCAALTESLLESELFGHEAGAFTDARESRPGKFELADDGTLFLDEIADMSPGGQAKLLRVLEQRVITRVGGSQPRTINVRIIAATNAQLAEAVRERRFREDLYYRLSVVTLDLPPLRDHPEDILTMAEFFLNQFAAEAHRPTLRMSPEARRRLQSHHWPGNVRELRNMMERVAFLCPGERVESEDLAFIMSPEQEPATYLSPDLGLDKATRQFQCEFIRRAIKLSGGNMSEAARTIGVHRSNLYRKMRQLEMSEVGGDQ